MWPLTRLHAFSGDTCRPTSGSEPLVKYLDYGPMQLNVIGSIKRLITAGHVFLLKYHVIRTPVHETQTAHSSETLKIRCTSRTPRMILCCSMW